MMTRRMRNVGLAITVGLLVLAGALAANLALLGLADRPPDRVGRLQLRLAASPAGKAPSFPVGAPALVDRSPPPLHVADDETGADD